MRLSILIAVALLCAACASATPGQRAAAMGPVCATPSDGSSAAAAAAAGGQSVGQDPRATDTARIQPQTTVGSGAGPTTASTSTTEGRVVASGAGVTQGLQVPTDALARSGGGAIPQVVQQIREDIAALQSDAKALLEDARCARAMGDSEGSLALMQDYRAVVRTIREMQSSLAVAESGGATRITHYYFQQGQRVVQSVVSGTSGGDPSVPPISEAGGAAAAEALTRGAEAVMSAPSSPVEVAPLPIQIPVEGAPAAPDFPLEPPAGAGVNPVVGG